MIDIATIKENYESMQDGQLIAIAQNDGHQLTPEAFQILKEEFKKRNLDYHYIESAEETKSISEQEKIQQVKDNISSDFQKTIWKYVLENKENGTSDEIIKKGLQQRGLDELHATQLLLTVKDKLKELINSSQTKVIAGGLACLLGIAVTFLTYSSASATGGFFVIAWGAMIFGAIKFFNGMSEKTKYSRILENIESNEPEADDSINEELQHAS